MQVYGNASASDCDTLTGRISKLLHDTLHIPENRIYISYTCTQIWGWNGSNF
ncbi:MAG: hypothetical protein K2G88_02565 [Oscillospiraceae bacterium]|nr:hypothetical protein [Oscillospiraceae bacterium]